MKLVVKNERKRERKKRGREEWREREKVGWEREGQRSGERVLRILFGDKRRRGEKKELQKIMDNFMTVQ